MWAGTQQQLTFDQAAGTVVAEPPNIVAVWQAGQVRAALERLRPGERQVLRLAYYDGLTQTEIAQTARCPARHGQEPHGPGSAAIGDSAGASA